MSIETLVREGLAFPPIHLFASPVRRLEVVRSDRAEPVGEEEPGPTAPIA